MFEAISYPDYQPLGIVQVEHDGTPEGIARARVQAERLANQELGDVSHSISRAVATNDQGKPDSIVGPNGKTSKLGTAEAKYAAGDLNAFRDDALQKILTARDQGDVETANALIDKQVGELESKIEKSLKSAERDRAEIAADEAKFRNGISIQEVDSRYFRGDEKQGQREYLANRRRILQYIEDNIASMREEISKWESLRVRNAKEATPKSKTPTLTPAEEKARKVIEGLFAAQLPPSESAENITPDDLSPVISMRDAEDQFNDGKTVYAFSEMDEKPTLVTSLEMLRSFTSDQIGYVDESPHFAELKELEVADWPFSAKYNGQQVEVLGPAADFDPNVLSGILAPDTTPDRFRWWKIETKDGKKQNVSVHSLSKNGKPLLPRPQISQGMTEIPSRRLFASSLPTTYTKPIPQDRFMALMDAANSLFGEGVNTPEALAETMKKLAPDNKAVPFTQSFWFALKAVGAEGAAEPDWAGVYSGIDKAMKKGDGAADDNAPQPSSGGQGPQTSNGVEPGTQEPVDSVTGSPVNRPSDQERQPENGEASGGGANSGTMGGNASRPGSKTDESGSGTGKGSGSGAQPGNAGTGSGNAGSGSGVAGGQQPTHSPGRTGYRLTDPETILGSKGPKDRFARNRKALETYDKVFSEGRDPTPEELDALAAYIGWGSFGQELFQGSWDRPNPKPEWEKESEWLRDHLGKGGWESIRDSIINAHYTDPPHVAALWKIVQHLGFKGGRLLEPSMGIGNFFGLMPDIIRAKSSLTGIELDHVVGGMAKMLYPDANIRIMGYEKSATADDFYDLIIGNWPFAKDGPSDPRYNHLGLSLHDYFFVKALDQVRPGGLVVGITSSGTMDKKGQVARRQMAKRAKLIGAFRFPTGAFKGYAGTSVVTDVLVLQKRAEPLADAADEDWIGTERIGDDGRSFNANLYWRNNPTHILGEMKFGHGTTFGRAGMIVERPDNYADLLSVIQDKLPSDIYSDTRPVAERKVFQNRQEGANQNSVVWETGDTGNPAGFYVVRGEQLQPLESVFRWELKDESKTEKRAEELRGLLTLREQVRALLASQRDNSSNAEELRAKALASYQAFAKKHGGIDKSFMISALDKAGDPMALTLRNIERKDGKKYVPRDILLKDIMRRSSVDARGNIEDAYALQRNESTTLDLARIAEMSESTEQEVIARLLELNQIYMTPSGVWETGEEYLGGNVRRKLREAKEAKSQGFDMDRNIAALEKIQPADVAYFEIEVQMGASWIPREDYLGYVSHLLGADAADADRNFTLVKGSSGWNFKVDNAALSRSPNAQEKWGIAQLPFAKIFQAAMNGTQVKVWNPKDEDGRVTLNEDATKIANGKIDSIREELAEWLWSDPERTGRLSNDYNEVMNSEVTPKRDGSHLRLEGLALSIGKSEFDFREHQKNAVWRFIMDGKGVGAHEVGTGKTFTMAGLAVEGRRLGKFRKTLLFAHNANSQAVYEEFQQAYPSGKFLYVDNLSPENRDAALRQIALDEWDAVIVPHSLVDRFSLSEASLMEVANKQIVALENEIAEALDEIGYDGELDINDAQAVGQALKYVKDSYTAKELVKQRLKIVKRIQDKAAKAQAEGAILFEELGIDNIIVDEAHVFKKINLATRKDIKGLNKVESGIGWQMGALTDYVKSRNGGNGVYLFTGTPLTNNLNEAYNMMRFVMDEEMADTGIDNFDDWFNSFAAAVSDVELTTGGTHEPVTRLLSFVNVPELARLAGRYFDVVLAKDMPEFKDRESTEGMTEDPTGRPFRAIKTVISDMSPQQRAHKEEIRQQYIEYQKLDGKGKRLRMAMGRPTPITMEGQGTASALDYRLVDPDADDYSGSKVNMMIGNAVIHYNEHPESTQMIFMERGFNDYTDRMDAIRDGHGMPSYDDEGKMRRRKVRHRQFNLARDIVEKLMAQGVAPEEIAILSNMNLDPIADRPNDPLRKVLRVSAKLTKAEIASLANEGKVRFMIGGTETMGTGVNAQRNLRAMHHLDAPWTPGALEQRNGRGWRQGNRWNTVNEYRYFAEGSHDGRRWQVLLNKVRFIYRFTQMLLNAGGESNLRVLSGDGADVNEGGSSVADFEQSFSAAAGDPRLLLRAKLSADVEKLERRRDTHFRSIEKARQSIAQIEREKSSEEARLEKAWKVSNIFKETFANSFEFEFLGKKYTERKKVEDAMAGLPAMTKADDKRVIGKYNGIELYFEWHPLRDSGDWAIRTKLADGRVHEIGLGSKSLASMEGTMRGFMRNVSNSQERFGEYDKSIASLSEMLGKPFTRQSELDGKIKALEMIKAELAQSPFPAPSWLRNGAPAGSLVYVNGEARDVGAHRWDKTGYWILLESENGLTPVDYRKVKDEAGNPLFEDHPFESPPDAVDLTEDEIRGALGGEFYLANPDDTSASGDGWHVSGLFEDIGSWRIYNSDGDILGSGDTANAAYRDYQGQNTDATNERVSTFGTEGFNAIRQGAKGDTPRLIQLRRQRAGLEKALENYDRITAEKWTANEMKHNEALAAAEKAADEALKADLPDPEYSNQLEEANSKFEALNNAVPYRGRVEDKIKKIDEEIRRLEQLRVKQSGDGSVPYGKTRMPDGSLRASSLPPTRKPITINRELAANTRDLQARFGKNVASGKLAGFGNRQSRIEQDIIDAQYEFEKARKTNEDAMKVARKRLEASRADVEEKLLKAAAGEDVALDAADEMAFRYLINERSEQAGDDIEKHLENGKLRMALRLQRADLARRMQIGYDRTMTPEQRAIEALSAAIYTPSGRVERYAEKLPASKRQEYIDTAMRERLEKVEKELRKLGVTLGQVTGQKRDLQLANSKLDREIKRLRNVIDQGVIKMVQQGASLADIKRRWKVDGEQAKEILTKARNEAFAKIRAMADSGMTAEQIRAALKDGLKASDLPAKNAAVTDAEIWRMIEQDLGYIAPENIPAAPIARTPRKKPEKAANINPLTSDWSRPIFKRGMDEVEFDTKDREAIMERVEVIRGLAGALGKIDGLTGETRAKAITKLQEINAILAKYGTDAAGIFAAEQGIEEYGFDINDVAQVAAVSRAISMIDADIVDKASEWLYFSMLSGLQTMMVNATAAAPAAWESTVGRGVESAINWFLKNPMSADLGEAKYVIKALRPSLKRAFSNARTAFAAQHPMFDRDVLAQEIDWERVMGGKGYRTGGSISGKTGDRIRIPMRILTATDDFNTTLMACVEVGTIASRIAKSKGMKPGSAEFNQFIEDEVNKPGSFSYMIATEKAKGAIFSNPLPGQHDPVTGKKVPVRDLGDAIGYLAGKMTDTFAKEHDNLFVKSAFAAMRIAFFPFQRTPFNILRKGVRYTLNPFSLFDIALGITRNAQTADGKWQWKIDKGEANAMERMLERERLVRRAAMQLQGAMLMLMVAGLAEGDEDDQDKPLVITGSAPFSPRGQAEREAAARSGLGPYRISFRRKDGTERFGFSYGRIEPMATTLAASIDLMKSVKRSLRSGGDATDAASAAMGGFLAQAQDKSFLKGVGDFVDLATNALAEPDLKDNRKMQQFLAGRVAMVMPNIIRQPIRESDENFRERSANFVQELLYQTVPYGQKPAKVDPYGQPVTKPGTALGRVVDVTDAGTDAVNPVDKMLLRFRDRNPGKAWFPSVINSAEFTNRRTGKSEKMTPAQLAEFKDLAGKRLAVAIKSTPLNIENPTELDVERAKKLVADSRSDAKKLLSLKYSR